MEFETPMQVAERLGVTVRAVQKWASTGKLKGAKKVGRDWLIPKGLPDPRFTMQGSEIKDTASKEMCERCVLPLMNGVFEAGRCMEYINSIADEDDRNIAMGEYYYYTGQAEKSAQILEPYLSSEDIFLKYSAETTYVFVNISLGRINLARFTISQMSVQNKELLSSDADIRIKAIGVLSAHALMVILHQPYEVALPPLEEYLRYLPRAMKLWACYVLAYKAYQEKNYEKALGIADLSLALSAEEYPIPTIYCCLVEIISLMGLMRIKEAKERFNQLWDYAKADGFVEIIGEHYGILQGIADTSLKKTDPEAFELLMKSVRSFGVNWIKLYNQLSSRNIAVNLSATEFTVATLYNRGWSAQEIAFHLSVSENTVRGYIKAIYVKLGISDKKALSQFMLH